MCHPWATSHHGQPAHAQQKDSAETQVFNINNSMCHLSIYCSGSTKIPSHAMEYVVLRHTHPLNPRLKRPPALRTRRFARERWSHFADPVDLRAWQPWDTIQLAQKCNGSSVPLGTNAGAHLDPSADDMFWVAGNRFPPRPNHCHHLCIYIYSYIYPLVI